MVRINLTFRFHISKGGYWVISNVWGMSTFTVKVCFRLFSSVGPTACSEQGERFPVSSGSLGWRLQKGGSVEGSAAAWCWTPAEVRGARHAAHRHGSLCFVCVGFSHMGFRYIQGWTHGQLAPGPFSFILCLLTQHPACARRVLTRQK